MGRLIDALDLRPAVVNEPEMQWDFPEFPWRVQTFIETGRRPKVVAVWDLSPVVCQSLDAKGNLLGMPVNMAMMVNDYLAATSG